MPWLPVVHTYVVVTLRGLGRLCRESGGVGAEELGNAVIRACDAANASGEERKVNFLYESDAPIAVRARRRVCMPARGPWCSRQLVGAGENRDDREGNVRR